MDFIELYNFTDQDIKLFEHWINKDYIKKWYGNLNDWIYEVNNRNGEFNFIKHFIVNFNDQKIGFCQYYDCYYAQEEWYKIENVKKTYSIDYLIGEENYLNKGYGKIIIKKLIEKIKTEGGNEIIVQPELENKASNRVLIANGFKFNKEKNYYYLNLF